MSNILHWVYLGLGAWLVVSPWILKFEDISLAKWQSVAFGIVLLFVSAWHLFVKNQRSEQ